MKKQKKRWTYLRKIFTVLCFLTNIGRKFFDIHNWHKKKLYVLPLKGAGEAYTMEVNKSKKQQQKINKREEVDHKLNFYIYTKSCLLLLRTLRPFPYILNKYFLAWKISFVSIATWKTNYWSSIVSSLIFASFILSKLINHRTC